MQRDASKELVFVEIDERSLRLLEVWPWPRSHHAELIARLNSAGARNIAIDIDFSSRSTPAQDALLEQALEGAERRVILPAFKRSPIHRVGARPFGHRGNRALATLRLAVAPGIGGDAARNRQPGPARNATAFLGRQGST